MGRRYIGHGSGVDSYITGRERREPTRLQELLQEDFECTKCGTSFGSAGGGLFQFSSHFCPTGVRNECSEGLRKLSRDEQINKALHQWQEEGCGKGGEGLNDTDPLR